MTKHSMTQHNEVTEMFLQLPGFLIQMYMQHYQADGEFVADIPVSKWQKFHTNWAHF